MYNNIISIISNYYYYMLKINLQVLKLFNKTDLNYILDYIKKDIDNHTNNNKNIDEYSKHIKQILLHSVNHLSKDILIQKIDFFLNTKIFSSIDKSIYINPVNIINKDKITLELLSVFFRTVLFDAILDSYFKHKIDVLYYKKYDNNLNIKNEDEIMKIYKIINYLEEDINIFYKNTYLSFYVNLINKIDHQADYIFPMIIDNDILLSGVINNEEKAGASTELIKNTLENMYSEPYIKNLYTKSEIRQLEEILNNEKLNRLIKLKKIRLSKDFQIMLQNIISNKENLGAKDLEDYVKKIFIVQNNEENIDTSKISDVLNSISDNKKFLEYFVDKIIYNEHLNNNNKDIVSMIDNVFDKILTHDYNHNSLNLENEDIKFILMLETLNTLKSNNLPSPKSNVTLNIYKDINKAKVNNEEIEINY